MPSVFSKLNLKDQREIVVMDPPSSFEPELKSLAGVKVVRDAARVKAVSFALVFATTQWQVDAAIKVLAPKAAGDALLWFAYPKGTSKRYQCDFNRDTGWAALGKAGFEPVRMVAIDADWSALRFRRTEFIKTLTRDASRTLSAAGKRRTGRS
ncbi:MAG TPA: hypothetical protein VMI92_06715 [Steroidobacteraceae bacterium]|nr:hypothetical protein [Steroidobacteraceae bacterium]